MTLPVVTQTIGFVVLAKVFMTFAWYAHLKDLYAKPWYVAPFVSWVDYLWAALCITGAVYFIFRSP